MEDPMTWLLMEKEKCGLDLDKNIEEIMTSSPKPIQWHTEDPVLKADDDEDSSGEDDGDGSDGH